MPRRTSALFVLLAVVIAPAATRGQTGGTLSLGVNVGGHAPADASAHGGYGVGPVWRFGHPETGWGWQWGLNWYKTDIDRTIGGRSVNLGELHVRPFMAGYGYTRVFGRASLTGDVLAGYALTTLNITPAADDAYHDQGARSVSGHASDTLALRPELTMWYDVNKTVGVQVNAGYMIARPRVTVSSTLGDDARRMRADMFGLKVGVAYSVF